MRVSWCLPVNQGQELNDIHRLDGAMRWHRYLQRAVVFLEHDMTAARLAHIQTKMTGKGLKLFDALVAGVDAQCLQGLVLFAHG